MHEEISADIPHKIIFFFMPESIVFGKPQKGEDVDLITLKSISPCFYWCSAHEFPEFEPEHRYLFQYQIYSVEGAKIVPDEIHQKWYRNKSQIRENIMSFIDVWQLHKRCLIGPEKISNNERNNSYNKIYKFNDFAGFVARSIVKFQKIYIEQASVLDFDILQKEFWKMIALNNSENSDYHTVKPKVAKKSQRLKTKTKKIKKTNERKISNK